MLANDFSHIEQVGFAASLPFPFLVGLLKVCVDGMLVEVELVVVVELLVGDGDVRREVELESISVRRGVETELRDVDDCNVVGVEDVTPMHFRICCTLSAGSCRNLSIIC